MEDRIVLWCQWCNMYYRTTREAYTGLCPRCGNVAARMRCTRCGTQWNLRDVQKLPKTCPGCVSPYFCVERTKRMPADRMAKSKERRSQDLPELKSMEEEKL